MIRDLEHQDLEAVVKLLDRLHIKSPYRALVPDWGQVVNTCLFNMQSPNGFAKVAVHKERITGVMLGNIQTPWWVDQQIGPRVASDIAFYSKAPKDGVRLLKALAEWAFNRPRVVRVECGYTINHPTEIMDRLYASAGYVKEGTFYIRNHPKYQAALDGLQHAA